jgi:hypothetical protein
MFVTQEKSFDLESTDPRGSPMATNLWLDSPVETDLLKRYVVQS